MSVKYTSRCFVLLSLVLLFLAGSFAWAQSSLNNFGGSDNDAYHSVTLGSDGEFVAVGYSCPNSFDNGDWTGIIGKGTYDAIIVKYDAQNNLIWKKNFGGSSMDYFYSVTQTSDGGFVAAGCSFSGSFNNGDWTGIIGKGSNDAIIVKYDADGNLLWKKSFGGIDYDKFNSVTASPDGGFVAAGYSALASFDNEDWVGFTAKGSRDAIIVKYDSEGNVIWKKIFGGIGNDNFNSITIINDGGFVAVGDSDLESFGTGDWETEINKSGGGTDPIMVKYDSDGNILWKQHFSQWFIPRCVIAAPDGGIIAVGYSAHIIKVDSQGTKIWEKSFSADTFSSVAAAPDGGFVAVGSSSSSYFNTGDWTGISGKGSDDAIMIKYSSTGNILDKWNFGGSGNDSFSSVAVSPTGEFAAVGNSASTSFGNGDWFGINGKGSGDATIIKRRYIPVTGITVIPTSNVIYVGDTLQINATIYPFNATNKKITWSSTNINIAKVDANGNVTPISSGSVNITVKTIDGNYSASCMIIVGIPVTGVSVNPTSATVGIGYTRLLTTGISPYNATNKNVFWSSSNPSVASVDSSGKVTALSLGNAIITGTTENGNKSATCAITTIIPIPVTGVTVNPISATLEVGATKQLIATFLPSDAYNKNINWSSSNPSIATVDTNGKVTALSVGNAEIILITEDGNKTATCSISVFSDLIWKNNFGGNGSDFFNSIKNTPDGGFITVGYSGSFGYGDWVDIIGKGSNDAIIVKFDSQCNVVWKKNFGGSSYDNFCSVAIVPDGGYIAVGSSDNFGTGDWAGISGKGGTDAIIVRYDADGNLIWKKNFGGSACDCFGSITTTPDGNFAVVGYSFDIGNGDWTGISGKGDYDAFIVEYDANGDILWKKNFGGSFPDYYTSITTATDGGLVAVGYSFPNSFGNGDWTGITGKGGYDAFIVKYDTNGNLIWKKNFGGSSDDFFYSVTNSPDGGFAAVGYSNSGSFGNNDWIGFSAKGYYDAIIVKFDTDGNIKWKKNFGGSSDDFFYSVTNSPDGGFAAVGRSNSSSFGNNDWIEFSAKGYYDASIVNYDTDGNVQWKKNFGGGSDDYFNSVTIAQDGRFVTAGYSASDSFNNGDWIGTIGKGNGDAILVNYATLIESINITPASANLQVGDTLQLNAIVSPADAIKTGISWSSSNNNIATVDSNGLVKAVSLGNVTITASTSGGVVSQCSIAVIVMVSGISVDPTSADVIISHTQQLTTTIFPSNATNKNIIWSSSNPTVAIVDSNGLVKTIAGGDAVILAKTEEGNKTATCSISVSIPIPVIGVTVNPESASLEVGETKLLSAIISPANASDLNIIWSSSDPWIAAIDSNGLVTGVSPGNVYITARTEEGNKTAVCSIKVTAGLLWNKNFGGSGTDQFYSIAAASHDKFIAVGSSSYNSFVNGDWTGITGKGSNDAIIVKYDANSNMLWKRNFGGGSGDNFYSVVSAPDGGSVAVGYSYINNTGDLIGITGKGGIDAIIVKYDDDGNLVWKKNFGGTDTDYFNSITNTPDGGFVAVGFSYPNSFGNGDWTGISGKGNYDATIVKYDADGNVLWQKNFGGSDVDQFYSITSAQDGGFLAVGSSYINNTGDWLGNSGRGYYDAIIVKYDADGNVLWQKNFGGSAYDYFYSVVSTLDGGFVAVGYSYLSQDGDWTGYGSGKGGYDAIIIKYDTDGNEQWRRNFGGSSTDFFKSVTATPDGGYAAVGYSYPNSFGNGDLTGINGKGGYDAIIVEYDSDGIMLWKQNFGGSDYDYFNSVIPASDGGFVSVGYSYPTSFGNGDWTGINGKGGYDAIIVKISPATIQGTIDLQSFYGVKFGVTGAVEIRNSLTGEVIETHPILLDNAGNYSFKTTTLGNYIVAAKCSHWLSQVQPVLIDFSNSDYNFSLINGDCNDDNQVDEGDFGLMSSSWYTSTGDEKFDVRADLSGDGAVDEGDFGILSNAWYQSGE